MAFNETIVQFINDSLKAGSLNNKIFQPGSYNGLVTLVARKKADGSLQMLPGIADIDGNYKPVEPNDKFRIIIYHRAISNSYLYQKQDSYGDTFSIKSTNDLQMIIWADTSKIQLTPELLEANIISGFVQKLSEDIRKKLKLRSCLLTPVSSDMDKLRVFRQEYQNTDFFLRPQHIFFSVRYRADLVFDQKCLEDCACG